MADRTHLHHFLHVGPLTARQAEEIAQLFAPYSLGKNEFPLRAGQVSDDYLVIS